MEDEGKPIDEPTSGTLTEKEIAEVKKQARLSVEAERKKLAKDALREEEIARVRAELGMATGNILADDPVEITIDVPPSVPYLSTNLASKPQVYHHGVTYTVPRHVADDLRSRVARTWEHEAAIDGKRKDLFRARGITISAKTGAVTGAQGLQGLRV